MPLLALKLPTSSEPTRASLKVTVKVIASLVTEAEVASLTDVTLGATVSSTKRTVCTSDTLPAVSSWRT